MLQYVHNYMHNTRLWTYLCPPQLFLLTTQSVIFLSAVAQYGFPVAVLTSYHTVSPVPTGLVAEMVFILFFSCNAVNVTGRAKLETKAQLLLQFFRIHCIHMQN